MLSLAPGHHLDTVHHPLDRSLESYGLVGKPAFDHFVTMRVGTERFVDSEVACTGSVGDGCSDSKTCRVSYRHFSAR